MADDLRITLENLGYEVTGAVSDVDAFFSSLHDNIPDLVLMDIFLNGSKDGIQLATESRSKYDFPIIYLTAHADEDLFERAKITEPSGYILKPYRERELHSSIEMALSKNSSEKRIGHLNSVLKSIREVNQLIVKIDDVQQLVQNACETLISTRGYAGAWMIICDKNDHVTEFAHAGLRNGDYSKFLNSLAQGYKPNCFNLVKYNGKPVQISHNKDRCADCPFQDLYPGSESLITRIQYKDTFFGYMLVNIQLYQRENEEEIRLFSEISTDLATAIHNLHQVREKENAIQEVIRARDEWEQTFNAIPDLIAIIDTDHRIVKANKAMTLKLNCSASDPVGNHCYELVHGLKSVPEFCPHAKSLLSGKEENAEVLEDRLHGIFDVTTTPLYDINGNITGSVHVAHDITLRKNRELMLIENIAIGEFALTHPLKELLALVIDKAEILTRSSIGFFHFVSEDETEIFLQTWSTRTLKSFCKVDGEMMHYAIDSAGVWVDCLRERRPIIHNDYASLMHRKGMPEGHATVIRELTIPVFRGDRIVAILGVGNKPVDYNDYDVEIVTQLINLAWEYIVSKQLEEKLKKKIDELEGFNRMMIDRELKMIELKVEINTLAARLGEEDRYIIHHKPDVK
jgi:CheY-like chemotaxis protein